MKRSILIAALVASWLQASLISQSNESASFSPQTTLRVNSRAVLVDVLVTDKNGAPVTGLKQDAFTVTEQNKPQAISYFEEHDSAMTPEQVDKLQFPKLPPNTFSNFSPVPTPPAVNLLLLDALNTPIADQIYLRRSAEHYLKTLKPGSRMAIFTMELQLRFVQGFSDDPAMLATALGYRKNNKPEAAVLLQSPEETNAQSSVIGMMASQQDGSPASAAAAANMIAGFQQFLGETNYAQESDREYRTLQNLNHLASFLAAFPGRKNLIWMSGAFPLALFGQTDMRFEDSIKQTINLLAAARVSVYPVDARGVTTHTMYSAENTLDPSITTPAQLLGPPAGATADAPNAGLGGFANSVMLEDKTNNISNQTMDMLARETGGKAFFNGNDLSSIIGRVVTSSRNFYTISYTPSDTKMDGVFRNIDVKVGDGKYTLSFRRGYYARDQDLPGAAGGSQQQALQQASKSPTSIDPLLPFMEFGLPQTEQILYKTLIHEVTPKSTSAADSKPALKGPQEHYSVDFAVDLKDLNLKLDSDGLHKGTLNLSLIVYDRYGHVASRADHLVALSIKPDIYAVFEKTGVQLHGEVAVPKGQYWLRTGVYDQASHKVGTMEIPLSAVKREDTASN